MARIIAVSNQKGGVGKTTTTVNLGASLAVAEKRTLVIDCDPQGNTTSALGFPKDPARRTLYQPLILNEPLERIILHTQVESLDIVPSDKNLAGAAVELVSADEREFRLKSVLKQVQDKYEFILIDSPPALDLLTLNALAAADSVLVPIQCEYLALEGVSELLDTLMRLRRTINPVSRDRGYLADHVRRPHHPFKAGRGRSEKLLRSPGIRVRNSKECPAGRSAEPRKASDILRHT